MSDHEQSDSFDALGDGLSSELDPKVASFLRSIEMSQKELNEQSTKFRDDDELSSRMGCSKLNSFLISLDLLNDPMELYGKLRFAPWLSDEDKADLLKDPLFLDGSLRKSTDYRGEYWQLAAHTLHLCPVDTDQSDDESAPISYVLTLRTQLQAQVIEDENGDPEYRGEFIMYPDDLERDIEAMKPSVPSKEHAERLLMEHYPELHDHIQELLPKIDYFSDEETLGDDLRIENLTRLEVPSGLDITPEHCEAIGVYLFYRLYIDTQAEYAFRNYQQLYGMDDDGKWVESKGKKTKLHAQIRNVEIDPATHQVSLVLVELASGSEDGYELRKIPVTEGIQVKSMRSTKLRFGKTAMMYFDSPEEAIRWYRKKQTPPLPELEEFANIVEKVDVSDIEYQTKADWYEISIDGDIEMLRRRLQELYGKQPVATTATSIQPYESERWRSIPRNIAHNLEETLLGEPHVFTRALTIAVADPTEPRTTGEFLYFDESESTALRGRLVGFCGAWFASPPDAGRTGQHKSREFGLAAIVESPCLIISEDDDQLIPLAADRVLVRMGHSRTKAYRIVTKTN